MSITARLGCAGACLLTSVLLPAPAAAQLVTSPGPGGAPEVRVIEVDGTERTIVAYHPLFAGGVRTALGDVNGDGVNDIITAAGPGGGPHVRVWNGVDHTEIGGFFAYDPAFPGGVFVAAGDVDGDGRADIITGAGAGGGPHVRVWSGATFLEIAGFFAYDPAFPGGVHVAAGDVNGDGRADVITGAGAGGGPHVRIWSGSTFSEIGGFFAYDPAFPGGVNVAAGDVNLDGRADIITGAGPGGGPHVRIWSGSDLSEIGGFFAFNPAFTGGVNVGAQDFTYDGRVEILTAWGPGDGPLVGMWDGATLGLLGGYFAVDPSFRGGVFIGSVGGSNALRFTSATTTSFVVGQAGSFSVTTSGGSGTPTLTITGALPSGVTFTDNGNRTATLAGTPASGTGGTYPLTFSASSGGTPVTQSFTLTVRAAPAITSANATTFGLGGPSTFTVTTTGVPTPQVTAGGTLPAGVTFIDNGNGTATLAGTPAPNAGGTYPLTITAANGAGPDATQAFVLTVNTSPVFTSANTATFTVGAAGTFAITTIATPSVTSISLAGTLPAGVTFVDNGNGTATLSGTPASSTGGTYTMTLTASNGVGANAVQTLTLTVRQSPAVTSASSTTFVVGAPGTFTVTTAGVPAPALTPTGPLPAGVSFTDNGNGTATIAGTPAAGTGGAYALAITAANGVGPDAVQAFTLTVNQAPAITSANAVTFIVGTPGTFAVTTTGVPVPALSVSGVLPAGVTFTDNGNGTATLSGTPAAGTGGVHAITLTAANGIGPGAVQAFTLTVNQPPVITSASSTTFSVGSAGTFTVTTTGVPAPAITQGGAALPAGVAFVDNGNGTATLSGTPGAGTGGTYAITFTATNGLGTAVQAFTLTVNEPPAITSANTTSFTVGTPGTFTVTTTGLPVAAIARTGAALPAGVTFVDNGNGTGTLSGTPAAGTAGAYAITFTAANGVTPDAVQAFTLNVQQAPAITSANATTFTVGTPGTFTVTTTGFPAPTVTHTGGTLPTGVAFTSATRVLGGTATQTGAFPLQFTAANGVGADAVQAFTLNVVCPAITVTPTALPDGLYQTAYGAVDFNQTGSTGSAFTWGATGLPAGLTIDANTGVVSGTPTTTVLSAAVVVTVTDNFGCLGTRSTTITVRPTTDNESYTGGVGNTQYVVSGVVPTTPHVFVADNVKTGDNGPGTLSVTFGPAVNGTVSEGPTDGTFTYTPNVNFAGPSDTFTYTLIDGNGVTNTGTVTVNLGGLVWYVNGSGGNGDGRSHLPFNSVSSAQAPSGNGQVIYVHTGAGPTPGTIVLKPSQTLWGAGATFTLNSLTIPFTGTPTLSGTVTLANDVLLNAFNISGSAGAAITGTGVGGTVAINNVNVLGGSSGINLTTFGGTLTFQFSSISGITPGASLLLAGGTGSVSGRLGITSTVGRSVDIQGKTAGTVTLGGGILDSGSGVFLNNNTGATINFTGGLTLNTGANPGFTATGGGTVSATQNNTTVVNTITTTTGTALNVANTTIGASGLTFRSISANGATNGIALTNTGVGGLVVTGNTAGLCGGQVANGGATVTAPVSGDCSGGVILGSTGAGVLLTNSGAVGLTRVRIANGGSDGISGSGVGGLTLTSSLIENNGNAVGERGLDITNLSGAGAIMTSTIRGSAEHNIAINNTTATLSSFNVTNSQISTNSAVTGDDGIQLLIDGVGNITASVTQSAFTDNKGDHFQAASTASVTGTINVTFSNNTLLTTPANDPNVIGGGITINPGNSATINFTISNNNIQQAFDDAINLNLDPSSTSSGRLTGTVSGNTIGTAGDPGSGSESSNTITAAAKGAGTMTVAIIDNTIREWVNAYGIFLGHTEGSGTANFTVTGNSVKNPDPVLGLNGIRIDAGATAGPPADSGTLCAALTGNDVTGSGTVGNTDIRLRQRFSTTIRLPGYAGANNDTTAVNAFVSGNNTGSPTVSSVHNVGSGGFGFVGGSGCPVP